MATRGTVPAERSSIPGSQSLSRTHSGMSASRRITFDAETLLYTLSELNIAHDIQSGLEPTEDGERSPCEVTSATAAARVSFRGLDGGYGWLVTLGSCMSHMVEGGFERGEGLFYLTFLQRFGQSHQVTTLPGAMASTLRFLLSPLASIVCNMYSIRTSVMLGALVFTTGVFLTQFAHSFPVLFLTYGVLTGCGRAFFSGPALIIIGLYFRQRQGVASGIAASGVGLGAFLLVPLIEFLLEHYNFQGAFLILSGVAAHMILVAMLYRPLSTNNRFLALDARLRVRRCLAQRQAASQHNSQGCSDVPGSLAKDCIQRELARGNAKDSTKTTDQDMALPLTITHDGLFVMKPPAAPDPRQAKLSKRRARLASWRSSLCENCCCQVCCPVETFNQQRQAQDKGKGSQLFQCHLLRYKAFTFYCLTVSLFTVGFKVVYVFLPTLVQARGYTLQDAAMVLSVVGPIDTASRITIGLIVDLPTVRPYRMRLFNGFLVGLALVSLLLPRMGSLPQITVALALYSMCAGMCFATRTVVLVDLMGVGLLSSSFGVLMFFQGFGTLLGPPLAGLLLDLYGSASYGYYMAAAAMSVAAVCMNASINCHNMARS